MFRRVFEVVLQRGMMEGLGGGEGFAIDASVIKADANRQRFVPAAEAKKLAEGEVVPRAVREYALDASNPVAPSSDSDELPGGGSRPRRRTSPPLILQPRGPESEAYEQSRKQRKKLEMLFAHVKHILRLDRLRLRSISDARDEFLMAAAAQNLRRMARWLTPAAV